MCILTSESSVVSHCSSPGNPECGEVRSCLWTEEKGDPVPTLDLPFPGFPRLHKFLVRELDRSKVTWELSPVHHLHVESAA